MDVHNLTALLFDLMVRSDTAGESGIFSDMNHTAMDTLLHNLTTLLMIHPTTSNDSMSLLNLLADMEKEDFWWKMVSNRRLGNIASIVLITAYVSFICTFSHFYCIILTIKIYLKDDIILGVDNVICNSMCLMLTDFAGNGRNPGERSCNLGRDPTASYENTS